MAECERGYRAAARIQVGIGSDAQGVGLLLNGTDYGAFDLAFSPGLENDHFQPEAAHRGLRLLDVIPRETRIVRIHKDRNPGRGGKEFMQQLQPLGNKFGSAAVESSHAVRPLRCGYAMQHACYRHAPCCARAASGHAAAPTSSPMNARRFTQSPRRRWRARRAEL